MKPAREPFRAVQTTYSIGSQTFQRRMFFRNERWARLFIETIYRYREKGVFQLHAFVVMPEHFHILLTPSTTLEKAVQYVKGGFSREARLKLEWKFPIWQKSFTDHRIRDAADCDDHIQYLYLNPVRRKLCNAPSEYPYSSAHPGFELDELLQRLKPDWWRNLDGTALHPSSRNDGICRGPRQSPAPSKPTEAGQNLGCLESSEPTGQAWSDAGRVVRSNSSSPGPDRLGSEGPKIRPANVSAIPLILSIQHACASAAQWKPADIAAAIAQPERLVLIAEKDCRIVGFLIAHIAIPEWELENIAVAPDARRCGVGRALMTALIERARQDGASEIRQEIRESNMAAQKLGLSVGFVQEGRRPRYYRDPVEDALLFKHLLNLR